MAESICSTRPSPSCRNPSPSGASVIDASERGSSSWTGINDQFFPLLIADSHHNKDFLTFFFCLTFLMTVRAGPTAFAVSNCVCVHSTSFKFTPRAWTSATRPKKRPWPLVPPRRALLPPNPRRLCFTVSPKFSRISICLTLFGRA